MPPDDKQIGELISDVKWLKPGLEKLENKVDKNHDSLMTLLDKHEEKEDEREEGRRKEFNQFKWAIVLLLLSSIGAYFPEGTKDVLLAFFKP